MDNVIETGLMRLQYDMAKRIKKQKGPVREALRDLQQECLLSVCDAINELILNPVPNSKPIEAMINLMLKVNYSDFEDRADALTSRYHDIMHLEACLAA